MNGLAQTVVSVSMAMFDNVINEKEAREHLETGARMVMQKHGKDPLVDAWDALHQKMQEVKKLKTKRSNGMPVEFPLYYAPLAEYVNKLR